MKLVGLIDILHGKVVKRKERNQIPLNMKSHTEMRIVTCKLLCRTDKRQGPIPQSRELYSISCDKPEWKEYEKTHIQI